MWITGSMPTPVLGLLLIGLAMQEDPGESTLATRIRDGDREALDVKAWTAGSSLLHVKVRR
jgi:hypothetical protein